MRPTRILGFDIVTIPTEIARPYWEEHVPEKYREIPNFAAEMPDFSKKYKKADTIARYEEEYMSSIMDKVEKWHAEREEWVDKAIRKGSLSGTFGRCVTWATWDGEASDGGTIEDYGSEKEMLEAIWKGIGNGDHLVTVVGYNLRGFDIPLLMARSFVTGAAIPKRIFAQKAFEDRPVLDLMNLFGGKWSLEYKKFAHGCAAMGIPAKSDIDGSQVYDAYLRGELERIYKYNVEDAKGSYEMYMKAREAAPWL